MAEVKNGNPNIMNHYTPKPTELAAILSGKQTAFISLVRPQPSKIIDGMPFKYKRVETIDFASIKTEVISTEQDGPIGDTIKPPYKPGQLIHVKEAYCKLDKSHYIDRWYVYKSEMCGDSERIRQEYIKAGYAYQWRSAITMPPEAARTWLRIGEVKCVRVKDVSIEQARSCVFSNGASECMDYLKPSDYPYLNAYNSFSTLVISKFGQTAWDDNKFISINHFKIEKK